MIGKRFFAPFLLLRKKGRSIFDKDGSKPVIDQVSHLRFYEELPLVLQTRRLEHIEIPKCHRGSKKNINDGTD